jgi:hypothetical protein
MQKNNVTQPAIRKPTYLLSRKPCHTFPDINPNPEKEMKRLLVAALALIPVFNAHAAACSAKSLQYGYSYSAVATNGSSPAILAAGFIVFDGVGKATVTSYGASQGISVVAGGTATYTVSPACVATVAFVGGSGTMIMILDKLDPATTPMTAYHGKIILNNPKSGWSALGEIDRTVGKF